MAVAGNTIRQSWLYLDAADAPKIGMTSPADVTFTLKRDSGAGIVTSGETITFTELGSGFYEIAFIPLFSGLYTLYLQELNADSFKRRFSFTYEVLAAGAIFTPAYANAFCAETDIETWITTAITATSEPNDTQAAGMAQARAAILMSLMAGWGYSVTPATVPVGSRIQDILRQANAVGAALDYTLAQQFRHAPSVSDRPALLQAMWDQYVGREGAPGSPMAHIPGYLEIEVRQNLASLATDHILSGDTLPAPVGSPPTDIGPGPVTMTSVY